MITYAKYRPTGSDCAGLGLPEFQDWFALLGQNRDSGIADQSNFASAIRILEASGLDDGYGDNPRAYYVARFGHWACGWLEVLLVSPAAKDVAQGIEDILADYPILDENDYSEREHACEAECWKSYGELDFVKSLREEYPGTSDRWDVLRDKCPEVLASAYYEACRATDIYVEMDDVQGADFRFVELFERADMRSFIFDALQNRREQDKKTLTLETA